MQKENIELRSPKVQNVIGKMPRRLVLSAILIYVIVDYVPDEDDVQEN